MNNGHSHGLARGACPGDGRDGVVTPVLLVLALIAYNVMIFAGARSRADRVVPDIVLAHAVAPGGEVTRAPLTLPRPFELEFRMPWRMRPQVEVSNKQGASSDIWHHSLFSLARLGYTCTMHYESWPEFAKHRRRFPGAPAVLTHERAVTVDPVASGEWSCECGLVLYLRAGVTGWAGRRPSLWWRSRFTVRLRGVRTAADCRQRTTALSWRFFVLGSHLLYGLFHRHRAYRSQWQCPRMLRKRTSLAHAFLPQRLGGTRALQSLFAPCSPAAMPA